MPLLTDVWLLCTTRGGISGSGADVPMDFEITTQGQNLHLPMGDLDGDQFAPPPTKADVFHWNVAGSNIDPVLIQPGSFRITNPSNDGWLPQSFFIIGRSDNNTYQLLLSIQDWGMRWFDSDGNSGAQHAPSWILQ